MEEVKVGDIVYEPYEAKKPGKVIEILKGATGEELVKRFPDDFGSFPYAGDYAVVKWIKPKREKETSVVRFNHLNSFTDLIADHKKKYENHLKVLAEVEKL